MFKLKRLMIEEYRNVKPGTELRFDDGLNLILGQNASGKTTLLGLISAVCRSAFAGLADEEFALEYDLVSERFTVTAKVEHRQAEPSGLGRELGAGPRWKDAFEILIEDRHTQARMSDVSSPLQSLLAQHSNKTPPSVISGSVGLIMDWSFIVAAIMDDQPRALTQELMTTFRDVYRHDESLDGFSAMTGRTSALAANASPPVARVHGATPLDVDSDYGWHVGQFVPAVAIGGLPRALNMSSPGMGMPNGTVLEQEFTRGLARILEVRGVAIEPNVVEQRLDNGNRVFRVEGFTFEITRPDGTTIHHDRLSYGQKRLLSFLYYLECNPHVVIADELVNGLHHRWIDACMTAMAGRQAFLTSQNPLLFDYVTFDSVERVQSSFITCSLELVEGREQLVWQNMAPQDARVFFDAYEVGIEHVGDILITRGLW